MKEVRELHDPRVRETVVLGTSDSGVRVAVAPKKGFSTAAGYFGLRFGSTITRFLSAEGKPFEVPDGSAHFLEHKLFEGREEKVFDRFGRIGASFNGGTGFYSTTYYFVSAGRFEEGLDILLDFVQHPLITEERVEKEKGIIEQEVRMYEDNPYFRGIFLLHRALYHAHPVRVPPGGFVASVRATTAQHLQACFDAFYRPRNLCLALSGDLDPEALFAAVETRLDPPRPGAGAALPVAEPELPAAAELVEEFPVVRPHVWIGWREPGGPGLGENLLRQRVVTGMALDLVFDESSPYLQDLYDRGVVDDTFQASFSCDADYAYAAAFGLTDEPGTFVREVRASVARFLDDGARAEDLERVRRSAWGSLVSGLQTPSALASNVLGSMLADQEPFGLLPMLESVTLEEVTARARVLLRPERSAVAILRPTAHA